MSLSFILVSFEIVIRDLDLDIRRGSILLDLTTHQRYIHESRDDKAIKYCCHQKYREIECSELVIYRPTKQPRSIFLFIRKLQR